MITCPNCHYPYFDQNQKTLSCQLCTGQWDRWAHQFSPLPQRDVKEQVAAWLGQLPDPAVIEFVGTKAGVKMYLYSAPRQGDGMCRSWAALTRQQSHWQPAPITQESDRGRGAVYGLHTETHLPGLIAQEGDPFLALGGQLLSLLPACSEGADEEKPATVALRIWILGKHTKLQDQLRTLSAYTYGTESGVNNAAPNPWGLRLSLWRAGLVLGGMIGAVSGGLMAARLVPAVAGLIGIVSGGLLFLTAYLGTLSWMKWRSLPKEVLERSITGSLLRVGFALQVEAVPADIGEKEPALDLLAGDSRWQRILVQAGGATMSEWPAVHAFSMSLPASALAGMVAPPETGEGIGLVDREYRQDVPAPPPARALVDAPFKLGKAIATSEDIGIDPDGHGMAIGGSRSGKSSFVFRLLKQLIDRGADAPGIFLVDPHASLSDGFLHAIDQLPKEQRAAAIQRLRVITPDQPEVVPLNLLAVPEFSWAGNAIVQAGQRIWGDYWGPRMQAALLGLFRLAHAWNMNHPEQCLGLLHVVFSAYNTKWRHDAFPFLAPVDRLGALALDTLLGQGSGGAGIWSQKWTTEVVSPILSKVMALELSPWLFAAMHQDRFVDLEKWVQNRNWIVMRLPAGQMGREGARLTAGIFYNVFDAAFRKTTLTHPVPFYFLIDEAQEIAAGMRLEAMLSEGAKFGARMFVLAQSLSMLRQADGFEQVVQALLANTSTQAFFSPDPEDADLIRATLSTNLRYGPSTLDLPSLQAWLRARMGGRWQPPTQIRIEPLPRANPAGVQGLIREVIAAHPEDYASGDGWQDAVVGAMKGIVTTTGQGLLDKMLNRGDRTPKAKAAEDESGGDRRLDLHEKKSASDPPC